MSCAAVPAFSAFLRVMELISSLEAEVSSSEAACSEAPCASCCEEEETCEAALATCSAPSLSSPATWPSARLMPRTTNSTRPPRPRERPISANVSQRLRALAAAASALSASSRFRWISVSRAAALASEL